MRPANFSNTGNTLARRSTWSGALGSRLTQSFILQTASWVSGVRPVQVTQPAMLSLRSGLLGLLGLAQRQRGSQGSGRRLWDSRTSRFFLLQQTNGVHALAACAIRGRLRGSAGRGCLFATRSRMKSVVCSPARNVQLSVPGRASVAELVPTPVDSADGGPCEIGPSTCPDGTQSESQFGGGDEIPRSAARLRRIPLQCGPHRLGNVSQSGARDIRFPVSCAH